MISEKLKEVGCLIKEKVLNGEYELISCSKATALILLEEGQNIELWIANEPKYNFDIYNSNFLTDFGINIPNLNFNTQKERLKAWRAFKPKFEQYCNTKSKREKQKKINRLRKELEELERED